MAGEIAQLMAEVAELRRRMAGTQYHGVVHEVKGDRIRVVWGYTAKGDPVLTPWLETANHRGGARERRFFKKGQNVTVQTVDGQMDEAATVTADAPNDNFPPPDQAADAGAESETYQFEELRVTKRADSYEIYFGKKGETKIRLEKKGAILIKAAESDGIVTIETSKRVEIKAKERVLIETPTTEVTGDLRVRGEVYARSESGAVALSTHRHGGVETGSGNTGPPNRG